VLENQPLVYFGLVDELSNNLILNCVSSPKCFSSQDCKMESSFSYQNWPKNLIMTLFPMDDVLLRVRIWKERCHAWSPVATTSHARTISMLLSKTRLAWALPYLFQVVAIWPGFACVSNLKRIHSLLLVIIKLHPWEFAFASATTWVQVLSLMCPSFSFWPIEWGSFWVRVPCLRLWLVYRTRSYRVD
jgi:hypothetical protein